MADKEFLGQISEVQLPGQSGTYEIKDAWAREQIETLSGYTEYLGVTTTAIEDGDNTNPITIGGESVTAKKGDIVNYGAKEFIWNGSVWQEFGDLSGLGDLAFADTASGSFTPNVERSGSITVDSQNLSASAIPVELGTTEVAGATGFNAVDTVSTGKPNITVTYNKVTGGSVTVNPSATFGGSIPNAVTDVSGGVASTSNYVVAVPASTYVTAIPSSATATGTTVTVGSSTVYGLSDSSATYMTGAESLSKVEATVLTSVTATTNANNFSATVASGTEILSFAAVDGTVTTTTAGSAAVLSSTTSITAGTSAAAVAYVVGKSGSAEVTQPTITIGAASYNTASTFDLSTVATGGTELVNAVTPATAVTGNVAITVSGSAVTVAAVTLTSESASASGTTENNIVTGVTTSTFYGTVSAYAGGSHTHDVTDTLTVAGSTTSVTVSATGA